MGKHGSNYDETYEPSKKEVVMDIDTEAAAAGLIALARHGIPVDVQKLLVYGNAMRGIPPRALSACIKAALEAYQKRESK